jgi:hypothetical protein
MEQSLSEIRQLLQHKIFAHHSINNFNTYSKAVLKKLSLCHTTGIGVHYYRCNNNSCHHTHYQYHSCGNRHCMNCGGMKREQWIQDRMNELLPTSYFHIVFTLPQELRSLCMGNRKILFNLLFDASHHTLTKLSADDKWLGAQPGITSILHTNGQDLTFHPHVHCIVSGGGINKHGKWITEKRSNGQFIFPRKLLEYEYKKYFLNGLSQLFKNELLNIEDETLFHETIIAVSAKDWNVYAKAPFGGPAQIVEYLGRYTHKVAITAHRIKQITDSEIAFQYKDYADGHKIKMMTLSHQEFLRRFEQHILPMGFVKIRHAGFLTNRNKHTRIASILAQLKLPLPKARVSIPMATMVLIKTGIDITQCPKCATGKMMRIATFINLSGTLVNIESLGTKNKGSPQINKTISYDKTPI